MCMDRGDSFQCMMQLCCCVCIWVPLLVWVLREVHFLFYPIPDLPCIMLAADELYDGVCHGGDVHDFCL